MTWLHNGTPVDAMQVSWENWSLVCHLIDAGRLEDGKPQGCYVDDNGMATEAQTHRLGVLVPSNSGVIVAVEGDWFVREGEQTTLIRKADWPADFLEVIE